MTNFSFDNTTKEFLNRAFKEPGIYHKNVINNVEVGNPEVGSPYIDITFENLEHGYTMRERYFAPGDNVPSWTTPEKEVQKLKATIKHIMARFVPAEDMLFEANGFIDMCNKVKERLDKYAVETKKEFSMKTVYDRNFTYIVLPSYPPFLAAEDDAVLQYSDSEMKRNFPDLIEENTETQPEMDDAPKF